MLAVLWTSVAAVGQKLRRLSDTPMPHDAQGRAPASTLRREAVLTLLPALIVLSFSILLLRQDPGFFWRDDYQTYQLAGFRDVARSWSEGEFPLVSPYSWQGGALAAEYQNGVFSVFLTGCVLLVFGLGLSLPQAAAALSIVHLAVLATGTFRLARRQGLPADLSTLAALVASLNGWIVLWGATAWFPALASFAWVPWVWWGLDRALDKRGGPVRFVPAGLFLYLLVTAGWPFTVLMIGLVTGWLLVKAWREGRALASLWPLAAAWGIGLGLSAPAWLMLVEFSHHTVRGYTPAALHNEWLVPISALPGLVFPVLVTHWKVFGGVWKPHVSAELAGGLVPVAVLATALLRIGRSVVWKLRWELALCGAALLLGVSPGFGNFRWSFRWLPLFFLTLGLTSAHALALLRASRQEPSPEEGPSRTGGHGLNPGLWATYLVLAIWARVLFLKLGPVCLTFVHGVVLAALCLTWVLVEARGTRAPGLRRWLPCGVVFFSCWITYALIGHHIEVPRWRFEQRHTEQRGLDPDRQYFSVYTMPDIITPTGGEGVDLFPGNSAMYSGLRFVNGYSPLRPLGMTAALDFGFHGFVTPAAGERLLVRETGPNGLLQRMGVDGLVVSECFEEHWPAIEANGWRLEGMVEGGGIFYRLGPPSPRVRSVVGPIDRTSNLVRAMDWLTEERAGPAPKGLLVRNDRKECIFLIFVPIEVTPVEESRNRVVVDVSATVIPDKALVVFSRAWYPGYRATLDGQPTPVEQLDLMMPAVRLPAGAGGRLVLEYRPRSLVAGCWLAAAAGLCVLLIVATSNRKRLEESA